MSDAKFDNTTSHLVRNVVISKLRECGSFTVPDIVEDTGISPTTVAKYIYDMIREGIIEETGNVKAEHRGRRPLLYGLKSGHSFFMGVDVKSFGLSIGLMDISGHLVKVESYEGFRYENTYESLEELCAKVEGFMKGLDRKEAERIAAICFGLGGRVDSDTGTSSSIYNLEEFRDISLASFFEKRFNCRAFIENDTKAMTYGEYLSLRDKSIRNMLYVNIGWGLGLGMVVDGNLLRGHKGYAGEFGHIHSYDNDIICHCGKKGCIETEVSGNAIHRKLVNRIRNGENSVLSQKVLLSETIALKDILLAAEKEDPLCVDLISSMGSELGHHLAGMINIFNPELIVIGGTFSSAISYYFLYPIRDAIRKYSLRLISKDLQVVSSVLGDNSGVLGTCMVARNRIFAERFA